MPTTTTVSNASELNQALTASVGGEKIVLRAGDYGALNLSGAHYASNVTITSETPLGASFASVRLSDVDNVAFKNIAVHGEFRAWQGSENIVLARSDVDGGVYFKNAQNVTVKANDITTNGEHAAIFNDTKTVSVVLNTIHDARSDNLRITGDSNNYRVADNKLLDTHAIPGDHPDMVQVIATKGGVGPHDLAFTGNVLYDDPSTGTGAPAQGFFLSQPDADGYSNVLIEDNLVAVSSVNSVFINGGASNVVVRDNVLAENQGGGTVRLVEMGGVSNSGTLVEHNVARQIVDQSTALSDGHTVDGNTIETAPVADLLAHWSSYVDGSFADVPHLGLTMADLSV